MNCSQAREYLPVLLYGDDDPNTARAVQAHLANCSACRLEFAALRQVRAELDAVTAPAVQVDLPRLFQESATRQARQARCWRRAAMAVGGVAAALLLILLLRLEVRFETNQLTVRWGPSRVELVPSPAPTPEPAVVVRHENTMSPELEERLRWMSDTLHALADLDARDATMHRSIEGRMDTLEARLETLWRQDGQRWSDTERSVAAIYKAMFVLPNKGEKQ